MNKPMLVFVGAVSVAACGRASAPAQGPSTSAAQPTRYETAQVSETAPIESGIPTDTPAVSPPTIPGAPPADQTPLTLTPASGVGEPRTTAAFVPAPTPAATDRPRDRPESVQDRESIAEIRSLIAADKALAPIASQLTIVARHGRIWLRGQVTSRDQRVAIERIARQAAGVLNVTNELAAME